MSRGKQKLKVGETCVKTDEEKGMTHKRDNMSLS